MLEGFVVKSRSLGENFIIDFGIPKFKNCTLSVVIEIITRVKPNWSMVKILGKSLIVAINPRIIPTYEIAEFFIL